MQNHLDNDKINSDQVGIGYSETSGRKLIAKRNFEPHETIVREAKPLLISPALPNKRESEDDNVSSNLLLCCVRCCKTLLLNRELPNKCGECGMPTCQNETECKKSGIEDEHKDSDECALFKELLEHHRTPVLTSVDVNCIAHWLPLLRCMLRENNSREMVLFKELAHNVSIFRDRPHCRKRLELFVFPVIQKIFKYILSPTSSLSHRFQMSEYRHGAASSNVTSLSNEDLKEKLFRFSSTIDTNAFRCGRFGSNNTSLRVVYILPSMINNNCTPNARITIHPDKSVSVKALRSIKSGDEITIIYCSPILNTIQRQNSFQTNKCFRCQCQRCCATDQHVTDAGLGSVKCGSCDDGICNIHTTDQTKNVNNYVCRNCLAEYTSQEIDEMKKEICERVNDIISTFRESQKDKNKSLNVNDAKTSSELQLSTIKKIESILANDCRRKLDANHSVTLQLQSELIKLYEYKSNPKLLCSSYEKRFEFVAHELDILKKLRLENSRQAAFTNFKLHNLMLEKLAMMQRQNDPKLMQEATRMGSEMKKTLFKAVEILRDDVECPNQLTDFCGRM